MLQILRLHIDIATRQFREEITVDKLRMPGYSLQLLGCFIHIGNGGIRHYICLALFDNLFLLFLFRHYDGPLFYNVTLFRSLKCNI